MNLEKLLVLRKEAKFTQGAVAKAVGVSLSSYRLWEQGVTHPNKENEAKIKKILNYIDTK